MITFRFCHPYEFELERFEPLPEQLLLEEPVKPIAVLETPFVEITEPHQVDQLVEVLRNCKEFAVDLEHHSYRTFMGITCLMQISTNTTDYIIDTLALRDKLYVLNEVFTKSTIVKVGQLLIEKIKLPYNPNRRIILLIQCIFYDIIYAYNIISLLVTDYCDC